ncbi:MAG: FAD-binding oxidoreductase [Acidimicrobiia bacterium]
MSEAPRRRSFWGWGFEDEALGPDRLAGLASLLAARFGSDPPEARRPVTLAEVELRPPRIEPPASLAHLCSATTYERARHCYGRSFRDVVRGFRGEFPHPPDVIAFPATEADVVGVLDWCAEAGAAAVPYGGGSSAVGGVECDPGDGRGVVTIDLTALDRVLEVDPVSRSARIQAGALGPRLEDQLRPEGLSLRHFPQSFEFSTLGGWIATRSGGHYATLITHIDELVEALRIVTPQGVVETRRLPASGAGPAPERLFIGSEGTLGIITEAWMRVVERPRHRARAAVPFPSFEAGAEAARALSQSGLYPSNCRLLDATEALMAGAGTSPVLLVGFESADHPLSAWMARALECCADHGGAVPDLGSTTTGTDPASDAWRRSFLAMPYLRDGLMALGALVETFETAVTWDRFAALHEGVVAATTEALEAVGAKGGSVACRFTHVYPDGPAPYFTVIAPGQPGAELEQWAAVKAAASEAIAAHGGTTTHHHAVGRDHRPHYDAERPDLFAEALRAAKRTLDPTGVLNPGVLFD